VRDVDPESQVLLGSAGDVDGPNGEDVLTVCHVSEAVLDPAKPLPLPIAVREQKRVAEDTIADVDASGLWPGKVVTAVVPAGPFWEAEPDHQDYLERIPNGYTCHFIRPDWKLPVRSADAKATAAE